MRVFLDDERMPPDNTGEWVIVRSYEEFITLDFSKVELISFDHDLGYDHYTGMINKTGYDCAKFLAYKLMYSPKDALHYNFRYTVHSMNLVGAGKIKLLLRNFCKLYNERLHERL